MVVTVKNVSRETIVFIKSGKEDDLAPGISNGYDPGEYLITALNAPKANTERSAESIHTQSEGITVVNIWTFNFVFLPLFGGETIIVQPSNSRYVPSGSYDVDITSIP